MHQRITYLLPEGTGIDPADIELTDSELKYRKVADAAEERRITLGLSELPKEVDAASSYHEHPVDFLVSFKRSSTTFMSFMSVSPLRIDMIPSCPPSPDSRLVCTPSSHQGNPMESMYCFGSDQNVPADCTPEREFVPS